MCLAIGRVRLVYLEFLNSSLLFPLTHRLGGSYFRSVLPHGDVGSSNSINVCVFLWGGVE